MLSLGVERGQPAHQVLDELTSREGLKPLEYQGNLISVDSPMRSLERNLQGACVLLVADAAGHAKAATFGASVVSGLRGAEATASRILRCVPYFGELRPLNRPLCLHDLIRWGRVHFSAEDHDLLLAGLGDRARDWLHRGDRDARGGARPPARPSLPCLSWA